MVNDEIPSYYPINSESELNQLKGYEIENITEASGGREVTHFFLKRRTEDGTYKHRLLMILADGKKSMTDEY